jgi:hypothetical protein
MLEACGVHKGIVLALRKIIIDTVFFQKLKIFS